MTVEKRKVTCPTCSTDTTFVYDTDFVEYPSNAEYRDIHYVCIRYNIDCVKIYTAAEVAAGELINGG